MKSLRIAIAATTFLFVAPTAAAAQPAQQDRRQHQPGAQSPPSHQQHQAGQPGAAENRQHNPQRPAGHSSGCQCCCCRMMQMHGRGDGAEPGATPQHR